MKRSEMINTIARTLEDINIENYYDEKGSKWCANLVLMEIEEKRMLPPDSYVREFYVFDDLATEIISEWEPEDETS